MINHNEQLYLYDNYDNKDNFFDQKSKAALKIDSKKATSCRL